MGYGVCTGPDMKKSESAKKFEYRSGLLKKLTISAFLGGLTAIALCGCTPEAFNIGQAQDLAGRFIKNFVKYETNEAGKALVVAGPQL